ncbi:MAG: hypothetical protein JW938_05720 [Candidatus Omnitrophica bacterium]|nr:hypothetical protein [Candidatus Omnitrophota bacterium]
MGAAQEAKMVKFIFLFGVLPIIVYSIGMIKLHSVINAKEAQAATVVSQVRNYYNDGFAMPSKEVIDAQRGVLEEARTKISSIMSYSCMPMIAMPSDVQEYGVYFKERLYLTEKNLFAEAKRLNATLPEDVGFDDELPNEAQVPFMLMQLEFVENVLMHVLQSEVKEIILIEFEESGPMYDAAENKMPCKNITVKISMNCPLAALKKVLYEIGNMNPFVVVEGLKARQIRTDILEVHMLVTRLIAEE